MSRVDPRHGHSPGLRGHEAALKAHRCQEDFGCRRLVWGTGWRGAEPSTTLWLGREEEICLKQKIFYDPFFQGQHPGRPFFGSANVRKPPGSPRGVQPHHKSRGVRSSLPGTPAMPPSCNFSRAASARMIYPSERQKYVPLDFLLLQGIASSSIPSRRLLSGSCL